MKLLTPLDVKTQKFTVCHKQGYDTDEVDDFLDNVEYTINSLAPMAQKQYEQVTETHNNDIEMSTLYSLTVPGHPVPKAQLSHFTHGHAMISKTTSIAERNIRTLFKKEYPTVKPVTIPIAIQCAFYMKNYGHPHINNLTRLVLDALRGIIYVNDSQIIHINTFKIQPDKHIVDCNTKKIHKKRKDDPLLYCGIPYVEHTEILIKTPK